MSEHVVIEGVRIPFWDLVWIFVKATFALIPAGIIIFALSVLIMGFLGAFAPDASAAVTSLAGSSSPFSSAMAMYSFSIGT